ncbi:unnamed protein product, partial [Rotaria sordida]
DGCLDRALAIVFAHEARCLALLDVQKKPLDDLKNSLELIYDKGHCYIYTYRCDLRFILFIPKITKDLLGEMISRSYGHIVNVVSSRALRENAFSSFYSSSTAALFTQSKNDGYKFSLTITDNNGIKLKPNLPINLSKTGQMKMHQSKMLNTFFMKILNNEKESDDEDDDKDISF